MPEKSLLWPTSGGTGDAEGSGYTSDQLKTIFRILSAADAPVNLGGVAAGIDDELEPTHGGTSPVTIAAGAAVVYGIPYTNSSPVNVTIPAPSVSERKDRIVLRADWAAQTVRITRIAGSEGTGSPPALTQNAGTTWDIPICQVEIFPNGTIDEFYDERDWLTMVGPRTIVSEMIGLLEVETANIDDNAITSGKILNSAVTTNKINDSAVTTGKINDSAVTAEKLATDAVETAKIKDGNVTAAKLASNAVETAKIADGNVTADKLASGAVETAKIGDLQVTGGKIANATIDPATKLNGTNGIIANVSDGNARGSDAVDLQTTRSGATAVASGQESVIGGGVNNTASGAQSTVAGGSNNVAGGQQSTVSGGGFNQATAIYAAVVGGARALANKRGQIAFAGGINAAGTAGAQQISTLLMATGTSNNSQTEMFLDGEGGSARLTIPSDTTWMFRVSIVARRTDADNESAAYIIEGCIDNNAGTTALVGTITKTVLAEDTSAWDVTAEADNTNDALALRVTGENGKSINWIARVDLVELTG